MAFGAIRPGSSVGCRPEGGESNGVRSGVPAHINCRIVMGVSGLPRTEPSRSARLVFFARTEQHVQRRRRGNHGPFLI